MSSFYEDASLVMIPSGYKTSKVYSAKPTTGSGDLDFTRSNDTATRVGPDGLIEKVRTNLLLQSQTFETATWGKSLVTITTDFDTAPNGTLTADRFVSAGGAFPQISQARTVVSGTQYTASLYVKSDGTTQIAQVIIIGGNTVSFTPTSTWQRISTTFTAASSSATFVIATNSATSPASSFVIWGAQIETGDIATDYIATTSAAVSVGPVANVPRLDYLGSSCPRLLLEPQRTNVIQNSENLSAANWTKTSCTTSTNVATAPDGTASADKLIMNNGLSPTSAGADGIYQVSSITSGVYSVSFFVKAAEFNSVNVRDNAVTGAFLNINLTTGAVTNPAPSQFVGAQAVNYGNGWYRVSFTSSTIVATQAFSIRAGQTGDGTSGFLLWGVQYELGAYATSYIPTLGAAVTRGADAASKTGISSLIGQTEGTIFAEIYPEEFVNGSYIGISDGATIANRIIFGFEGGSANSGFLQVYGASGLTGGVPYTRGQRIKIAIGYKSGSSALYINGNLVDSKTTTFTATFTKFGFDSYAGTQNFVGKCSQLLISKTRLTNAQLAELTTL